MTLVALWWEVPLPLLPGESPPGGTFRALNTRNRQRSHFIYNDPNPSWRKPRYHNLNLGGGQPPRASNRVKTFGNGYLGYCNDEERSEMRYVM